RSAGVATGFMWCVWGVGGGVVCVGPQGAAGGSRAPLAGGIEERACVFVWGAPGVCWGGARAREGGGGHSPVGGVRASDPGSRAIYPIGWLTAGGASPRSAEAATARPRRGARGGPPRRARRPWRAGPRHACAAPVRPPHRRYGHSRLRARGRPPRAPRG